MLLPEPLKTVLDALRRAGSRPRLVGGCVRDWILGLTPKDIDMAQAKAEGVDFQNPTTFGLTSKYTLTPGVVMAQALLTDEDVQTDPSGASQDAAQELGAAQELMALTEGMSEEDLAAVDAVKRIENAKHLAQQLVDQNMDQAVMIMRQWLAQGEA